jgi:hypothetical protein
MPFVVRHTRLPRSAVQRLHASATPRTPAQWQPASAPRRPSAPGPHLVPSLVDTDGHEHEPARRGLHGEHRRQRGADCDERGAVDERVRARPRQVGALKELDQRRQLHTAPDALQVKEQPLLALAAAGAARRELAAQQRRDGLAQPGARDEGGLERWRGVGVEGRELRRCNLEVGGAAGASQGGARWGSCEGPTLGPATGASAPAAARRVGGNRGYQRHGRAAAGPSARPCLQRRQRDGPRPAGDRRVVHCKVWHLWRVAKASCKHGTWGACRGGCSGANPRAYRMRVKAATKPPPNPLMHT